MGEFDSEADCVSNSWHWKAMPSRLIHPLRSTFCPFNLSAIGMPRNRSSTLLASERVISLWSF